MQLSYWRCMFGDESIAAARRGSVGTSKGKVEGKVKKAAKKSEEETQKEREGELVPGDLEPVREPSAPRSLQDKFGYVHCFGAGDCLREEKSNPDSKYGKMMILDHIEAGSHRARRRDHLESAPNEDGQLCREGPEQLPSGWIPP